ncbi:hypothetical protein [Paenibacillus sp. N3.4]|uniref:hypothetical protein n=1 Tax=Paenibacillus sp. N3.4 TaxID=2603222 RepID=UPI0011CCC3A0|nr:hypothetical protein [Paenibacillus sp. N3.4]TXK76720.1 hypothetical protein FU659_24930 [Paenibacillus sp. N3.4]
MSISISKEQLYQSRRVMLIGFLIGITAWEIPRILKYFLAEPILNKYVGLTITLVSLIGWCVWVFYLIKVIRFGKIMKQHPELNKALNDELFQFVRLKSFAVGFWVLLALQVILLLLSSFLDLPARAFPEISIFVAVIACLLAFLRIEKE